MKPLIAILFAAGALAAKDTPAWVLDAAHSAVKSEYPSKVMTLVLLQEEHLTVQPDGKRIMTERGALKILQPMRRAPSAYRAYNTKTGRIRDFRGWMVMPSGKETEFAKNQILDVSLTDEYTYDEGRAKVLECQPDAPPGSVFAWEVTEEEDTNLHHVSLRIPGLGAGPGLALHPLVARRMGVQGHDLQSCGFPTASFGEHLHLGTARLAVG